MGTQAIREAQIASVLDDDERTELHALLRTLMRAFPDHVHAHGRDEDASGGEESLAS